MYIETNDKLFHIIKYSSVSDKKLMEKLHLKKSELGLYANFCIARNYYKVHKRDIPESIFYESSNNLFVINKIFKDVNENFENIERTLYKLINIVFFNILNEKASKHIYKGNIALKYTRNYLHKEWKGICEYLPKKWKKVNSIQDLMKRISYICAFVEQNRLHINELVIDEKAVRELMEILDELNQYQTIYDVSLFSESIFAIQKNKQKKDVDNGIKDAFVELLYKALINYALFDNECAEITPMDAGVVKFTTNKAFINPSKYSVLATLIFNAVNIDPSTKNMSQYVPKKDDMLAENVPTEIAIRNHYDTKNNLLYTEQFETPLSFMKSTSRKVSGLLRMSDKRAKSPSNMNLYYTMNESMKVNQLVQYGERAYLSIVEKRQGELMQNLNVLYVDIDLEMNNKGNMRSKKALESAKRRTLKKLEELEIPVTINETMHGFHVILALSENVSRSVWENLEVSFIEYFEKHKIDGIDYKVKDTSRYLRVMFSIQTEAPQDFEFDESCNMQVRPIQVAFKKYNVKELNEIFGIKEIIDKKFEEVSGDNYKYNNYDTELTIDSSSKDALENSSEKIIKENVQEAIKKVIKKSAKKTSNKTSKQTGLVFSILSHFCKLTILNKNDESERVVIPFDDEKYVSYYPEFTALIKKIKKYTNENNECLILPLINHSIKPCVCNDFHEARELIVRSNCFADLGLPMGIIHDVFRNNDTHPSANIYYDGTGIFKYKSFVIDLAAIDVIAFVAILLNVTYDEALRIMCSAYKITVLIDSKKKENQLLLDAEIKIIKVKNVVLNVFNKFKLTKEIPLVKAFFDSVLLAYTNIVKHNKDYKEDIFNTVFTLTWRYFMEYLNKNTNIPVNRSKVKTFIRMLEFMGILVKVDPEGMEDKRIQQLNHVFEGIKYGKSFPSMYYLKDISAYELENDIKELQSIVGEKLRFSKYDTHEKIKNAFPEKYVKRVIINSNQWKNRTVSISKKEESSEGFSIVSFEHPFKNSYKGIKKSEKNTNDIKEWLKTFNIMEKNVYTQIDIFNQVSIDMKGKDAFGKNEHLCVPVNTLTYNETLEGFKVNNTYSVNTVIIHISGERTEQKDKILNWVKPTSIIYTMGEKPGYYLMFKLDSTMTGKKAKGFELFMRYNVYKLLMNQRNIFNTAISLSKSESMTAVPIPYTKKVQKHFETEIVYFNPDNVKNYIFYTIGNTDCHQFKEIRTIERMYTKVATLKSSFYKRFKTASQAVLESELSSLNREIYSTFEAISQLNK